MVIKLRRKLPSPAGGTGEGQELDGRDGNGPIEASPVQPPTRKKLVIKAQKTPVSASKDPIKAGNLFEMPPKDPVKADPLLIHLKDGVELQYRAIGKVSRDEGTEGKLVMAEFMNALHGSNGDYEVFPKHRHKEGPWKGASQLVFRHQIEKINVDGKWITV